MARDNPDFNVEILGINLINAAASNPLVTSTSTLPWLQDTAADAVSTKWMVTYRDVRIIDAEGRLAGVFNLTEHDLGVEQNQIALKKMLLETATAVDTDEDGLPDAWERRYFGNLDQKPEGDPDGDGISNLREFAFGTVPNDSLSHPALQAASEIQSGKKFVKFKFRRAGGGLFRYDPLWLKALSAGAPSSISAGNASMRNLYDGTGASEMTWSLDTASEAAAFFNVQATVKP
ncbi:MAG: hypothetical protein EXS31_10415 [Pedosphaera sp.]|nr:hypothetical protein [Pedosphaera sp.]